MTGDPNPRLAPDGALDRCPDPVVLADYLEGRLDAPATSEIEEHVSACGECYFVVRESGKVLGELDPHAQPARRRPAWSRALLPLAAALAVATVPLVWLRRGDTNSASDGAVAPLVEAVGAQRLIAPRLAGGFAPGPVFGPQRGSTIPEGRRLEVLRAAGDIKELAEREPNTANRQALAAAHLLTGETTTAIEILEALAAAEPDDARVQNDLAAALLVRNEAEGEATDLVRGLNAASRAVELAPRWPEGHFNKALALERLHLVDRAVHAWTEYIALAREKEPAWIGVAERHLRDLRSRPAVDRDRVSEDLSRALREGPPEAVRAAVRTSVEGTRQAFEAHLLPRFRTDAAGAAVALRSLGAAFQAETGDATIRDAAAAVTAHGNDVVRLHLDYAAAVQQYLRGEWSGSSPGFARVARAAGPLGSPLGLWSELHMAIVDFQQGRVAEARERLDPLLEERGGPYPLLRARAEWTLGILAYSAGDFDVALQMYRASSARFSRAGDHAHGAYMGALIAEVLGRLGRHTLAWVELGDALRRARDLPDPKRRSNVFVLAGTWSADGGWPHAAEEIHREAVAATHGGALGERMTATLGLARSTLRAHPREGAAIMEEVEASLHDIQDPAARERYLGEFRRVRAETALDADDPSVGDTIEWLRQRGASARLLPLLLRRGLEARDLAAAERDLDDVVRTSTAAPPTDPDWRSAQARYAVEALESKLERLAAGRDAQRRSLDLAEQRWEAAAGDLDLKAPPLDHATVAQALPRHTRLIAFASTPSRLLSWCLRPEAPHLHETPIPRGDLDTLVALFTRAVAAGRLDHPAATTLYGLLMGPHADHLDGARTLLVVASRPVSRAPLALLRAPRGTLLAERFAVAHVPHLRSLVPGPDAPSPYVLLAISHASGAADLPRLPLAEVEAATLAQAAPSSLHLRGPTATVDGLRRALIGRSVLHFSGHAIENLERPHLSSLVVSDGGEGDAHLTGRFIRGLDLRRLRLVTLSSCGAGRSRASFGDGSLTLARPFLLAGAHHVVAPLWEVSDSGMPSVMSQIHDSVRRGEDPPAAVQRAVQRALAGELPKDALSLAVFTRIGT